MIKNISYYNSALWLASAYAMSEALGFIYFTTYSLEGQRFVIRVVVALLILLGLWLLSKLARYFGGAWYVISLASVLWPLFSSEKLVWSIGIIWVIAIGVLSVPLSYILLLSRKFAAEFFQRRQSEPRYKQVLRKIVLIVVLIAMAVATINDFIYLATS